MKRYYYWSLILISMLNLVSCGTSSNVTDVPKITEYIIPLTPLSNINHNEYYDLNYGINIEVIDNRINKDYLYQLGTKSHYVNYTTSIPLTEYISESLSIYMTDMGFDVYSNNSSNYIMTVTINNINKASGKNNFICKVNIKDNNRNQLYSFSLSSLSLPKNLNYYSAMPDNISKLINRHFKSEMMNLNWDRIATYLMRSDKPAQEANNHVTGAGDTALESTILRWYVVSAPAGADVYWRVVSSTTDVKNNNQNYLGSTPYESTESFDIMGLTYNNSGNVQIEITCEKPGYITQRKRFNVRQAIDQKEISTKFNLVPED